MSPLLEMAISHRVGDFALDVDIEAPCGPLVVIGPSGAGKTLTLRAIAGLVKPGLGRIALNGRVLVDTNAGVSLPPQARGVGYVPQEYALFPHMTVQGNIAFGLRRSGDEKQRRVDELLELTGLVPQRGLRPRELSGGQRQRVALARALAVKPEVLLLDEPFAALDVPTRQSLMDDFQRLLAETGTAAIMVTHDRNEALRLAEFVAVLIRGQIHQTGLPAEVFASPVSEEVAAFVGVETIVPGKVREVDNGVPISEVAGHVIEGGAVAQPGDNVFVCLRPEDVTISLLTSPSSARNHLPARVTRVVPSGPYFRVELDAGFPLVALVTRRALEELLISPGSEVVATFKASAVHLIRK
jgi:molybdenum ABC transporter ATP-binding protein